MSYSVFNLQVTQHIPLSLKHCSRKNRYDLVEVGIGKAFASAGVTRALLTNGVKYDMLAVVGFAAAALGRKQGDIVMPSRALHHDAIIPEGFIPEITDARRLLGTDAETVFTGDSFVNADIIRQIKARYGAVGRTHRCPYPQALHSCRSSSSGQCGWQPRPGSCPPDCRQWHPWKDSWRAWQAL